MIMFSSTVARVPINTAADVNRRIDRQTQANLARYVGADPAQIEERLRELDREWDIERALEANASVAVLTGVALGATVDKRWFFAPAIVAGFLLQHALQGWCPPVPLMRRLGFRTASEIDYERYALKAMRGDFRRLPAEPNSEDRIALERLEGEGGPAAPRPPVNEVDAFVGKVLRAVESN
jgi:hypothetical protein